MKPIIKKFSENALGNLKIHKIPSRYQRITQKIIEMFLDITLPEFCETFFPKNYFKFALEFPAEFSSNFPVKQQNGINSGTTQQI